MVTADELDLLELVTAGDWLLRIRRTTVAKLEAYARGNSSWGCRTARDAVGLVRERVDSPVGDLGRVYAIKPGDQCAILFQTHRLEVG